MEICAICYEEEEKETRQLLCGHWFHSNCIGTWLDRKGTCPTCRGVVPGYDGAVDGEVGNDEYIEQLLRGMRPHAAFEAHNVIQMPQLPELPQVADVTNIVYDTPWIRCQIDGNQVNDIVLADVHLVINQTNESMVRCIGALHMFEGDIVNAILHLTVGF